MLQMEDEIGVCFLYTVVPRGRGEIGCRAVPMVRLIGGLHSKATLILKLAVASRRFTRYPPDP